MRTVNCPIINEKAPALKNQTYPGELGKKIFDNISEKGWKKWLSHQTMLINENRLNLLDKEARKFLEQEMEKFFFGGGSEKPQGYKPSEE